MRAGAISGALVLLVVAASAAAQTEPESHILGAFTSGAEPQVLATDVGLGPKLRAELGSRADRGRIYDALVARTTGSLIRVNPLTSEEAARHAALVGSGTDPLLKLEAGGVTLLLQYAPARRQVSFVEQIGVAPPPLKPAPEPTQVDAPQLPPQPPKQAPLVQRPLPSVPPPVPTNGEKPKPAAVAPKAVEKPRPPAPVAAQPEKPRGECEIKPVMSDEDLHNCGVRVGR